MHIMNEFLPVSPKDLENRGYEQVDFVLVTGDAYVDHPSFGMAVIGRVLEKEGFTVAILSQPNWNNINAFKQFGRPRLGFLVTSGNMDSMVNHYTVAKKRRTKDSFSPGGQMGRRPDRATSVYGRMCKKAYDDVPVIIGGIEASLRRFAHYDYWDNEVKPSILIESDADLLVYGMGENAITEIAHALNAGIEVKHITFIRGTCYKTNDISEIELIELESYETVCENKKAYARAFKAQYVEQDAMHGKTIAQKTDDLWVVQNPPAYPLTTSELDTVYELPYTRRIHPMYEEAGVPAVEEIVFSINSCRGCYGGCSFCALTFHQGRTVQARSIESTVREAEIISKLPDFKGNIHDVGGPTANFSGPACDKQEKEGACLNRRCLTPKPCPNLKVDHKRYLKMLKSIAMVDGIKRVFVRSGLRFDYIMLDKDTTFFQHLVKNNVSGQLKVAPEHVSKKVLKTMGKPQREVYDAFKAQFEKFSARSGKKQYIVPYFMSSHPGCSLKEAVELAEYLRDTGYRPQQVQDFYPTPGTISTCMYYSGYDPFTMEKVYVPRNPEEKAMQRALMQYDREANYELVKKALIRAKREDLIGHGKLCLIRNKGQRPEFTNKENKKVSPKRKKPRQKSVKKTGK